MAESLPKVGAAHRRRPRAVLATFERPKAGLQKLEFRL